jgi:hypothetical protein
MGRPTGSRLSCRQNANAAEFVTNTLWPLPFTVCSCAPEPFARLEVLERSLQGKLSIVLGERA